MYIDEKELDEKEQIINNLHLSKEPHLKGSDKYEDFCFIMRITEWYLWKLREAKRAGTLANHYYDYKRKYEKSVTRRLWLTYAGFFLAYLIIIFCITKIAIMKDSDLLESLPFIAIFAIPSLVVAGIHFLANFYIFNHIDLSETTHLVLTFLGFSVFYLISFFMIATARTPQKPDTLVNLFIPAGIASALHIWVNNSIFSYLHKKDVEAYEHLKSVEDEIREIDKNIIDVQDRPIAESVRRWKENVDSGIKQLEEM